MAILRFEIQVSAGAEQELHGLPAFYRAKVREAIEAHLRFEPRRLSKSRIKRLRGMTRPQYRLRVDDIRVFYDVSGGTVEVLAIIPKPEAERWLQAKGVPHEEGSAGQG